MNRDEMLSKLNEIFCEVFDDETLIISEDSSADDVDEWDSMEQINILLSCEKIFNIKFEVREAAMLSSVKSILDLIENKIR